MLRGITRLAWAGLIVPVAGGLSALSPRVHVIPFSPAHTEMRIRRSDEPGGGTFRELMKASRPDYAINGTFYGRDGVPLGILRSQGRWIHRGGHLQTTFAVNRKNTAVLTTRDAVRRNPSQYPFAIAGGPRLLKDSRVSVHPEAEGFSSGARRLRASRVALGVRRDGSCVVIVEEDPVTLEEFAATCRKAGAVDAVNLDGGGATALYQGGRYRVAPFVPMVNIVMFTRR